MDSIRIKNKKYKLPIYLPDATRAVTKCLDSQDLRNAQVNGVVVNTYHLATSPGTEVLNSFGGIKDFMNYDGLVVSDSGGWQVFSLIHRSKKGGKITDEGVEFVIGGRQTKIFTPEQSIKTQFEIGSDIIICLDDFTPPDATAEYARSTVERTTLWAKECKRVFKKEVSARGMTEETRPHLFAVIQGGFYKEERKRSAKALTKIGFDGYGYGGYVIKDDGNLDLKLSKYVVDLLPDDKPKFALGFGRPNDIAALYNMGWNIFDCTLPTRDARHRRLYVFNKNPKEIDFLKESNFFNYIYINKAQHSHDPTPISKFCDCQVCKSHSKAYLGHLFRIGDMSAYRLASIHNLRFYTKLVEQLSLI